MTDAQAALAQVREALAAGPTPGRWEQKPEEVGKSYIRVRGTRLGCRYKIADVLMPTYDGAHGREAQETRANASLIAACSPANIAAILAHVEAQAAEIERLRKLLCQCDMRTRLVGDGCEFCNPTLADELAKGAAMSKMRDADMPLTERIEAAIERITHGQAAMRVPVEATDPDIVLDDCRKEIERLTAALRAQPGPVSIDDMEWAGKVHLAEAIRERDELRRQIAEAAEAIAWQAATIRGLTRLAEES